MTALFCLLAMLGLDIPIVVFVITIPCDTLLLAIAMLTGVIHA